MVLIARTTGSCWPYKVRQAAALVRHLGPWAAPSAVRASGGAKFGEFGMNSKFRPKLSVRDQWWRPWHTGE